MKKSAFTMLELVFVIVVIGILSAIFIPRFSQNKLSDAANQLISHIRYTQHLALMDDEYNASSNTWYYKRWAIDLCQPQYRVARSDDTLTALDPQTKQLMTGATVNQYDLNKKYNVSVITNGKCRLIFDNLGRPYSSAGIPASPYADLITTPYDINLTNSSETITIRIEPETGYVHIK